MSAAITLDMLRSATSEDFPVIDLGAYRRGEAGALGRCRGATARTRSKTSAF